MIPVFVLDRYEGFDEVVRFVDLSDDDLDAYLDANVEALRAAAAWHGTEIAFTGHAVPGAAIGGRALGAGRYVAKIHGSDLEYAVRIQERYRELAREGLVTARAVVGPTADVLARCAALVPGIEDLVRIVPPGVEVTSFRPRPRTEALLEAAELLDRDPDTARGRPSSIDARRGASARAIGTRPRSTRSPRPTTSRCPNPTRRRGSAGSPRTSGPIVGYLGKLIPQKGVELLLAGAPDRGARGARTGRRVRLVPRVARRARDRARTRRRGGARVAARGPRDPDRQERRIPGRGPPNATSPSPAVSTTGTPPRRSRRWTCMVVPSILREAFGMVAAEGAAAGALPLVARHSGLAEVGAALEAAIERPGLLTFEPAPGPSRGSRRRSTASWSCPPPSATSCVEP